MYRVHSAAVSFCFSTIDLVLIIVNKYSVFLLHWLRAAQLFVMGSLLCACEERISVSNHAAENELKAALVLPGQSTEFNERRRALVEALGRPSRLLVGLGSTDVSDILAQQVLPDVLDVYLTGIGRTKSWRAWNSPDGEYLLMRLREAESVGAVPMLTVYQIAAGGEGRMDVLGDSAFMQMYWGDIHKLMTLLKVYDKPVLLNIEPDFWGYTQRYQADPDRHFAHVGGIYDECRNLGNTVSAMAQCMIQITRKYAPKARIGFPPSGFGDLIETEAAYMRRLGVERADFAVIQTGDRDAGCYEVALPPCDHNSIHPGFRLWDEQNVSSPNFAQHLAYASRYAVSLQLPLLWWQTSLGAPSDQVGGKPFVYRDVKVRYFLSHGAEVVDAGGFALVFSPGEKTQTNLKTDGGQFARLSRKYLLAPTKLP